MPVRLRPSTHLELLQQHRGVYMLNLQLMDGGSKILHASISAFGAHQTLELISEGRQHG